jgi:hypothetical protein
MMAHVMKRNTATALFTFSLLLAPFHPVHPQVTDQSGAIGVNSTNRTSPVQALTFNGKFQLYVGDTYGPRAWLTSASTAGIRQWINSPPEWEQGMRGYARRFASSMGENAIRNTVRFGVGAALHEDPRYFPSVRKGILRRSWYAVTFVFVPRNDHGERTLGVSRLAGALSSGFISNTWYPERLSDTSHAMSRAGIALGGDAALNLFHEFWPDIKRAVFGR